MLNKQHENDFDFDHWDSQNHLLSVQNEHFDFLNGANELFRGSKAICQSTIQF